MKCAVPTYRLEEFTKKFNSIANKAVKHGATAHMEILGTEVRNITRSYVDVEQKSSKEIHYKCEFTIIEVEAEAKYNGWEFIASIEHTENGNIIHSMLRDEDVPSRYRTSAPYCEHCNSQRARKETYLVRNTESGEYKQLGKSCLKEYTNGLDASAVASVMEVKEYSDIVNFGCDFNEIEHGGHLCYDAKFILASAFMITDKYGYVKRYNEYGYRNPSSTYDRLFYFLHPTKDNEDLALGEPNMEDPRIEETIALISRDADKSDYMSNLSVIFSNGYVNEKSMSIICSAPQIYNREMETKRVSEANKGIKAFEAKEGDKVVLEIRSARILYSFDSYYGGTTTAYGFVDMNEHMFVWKTSSYIDFKKINDDLLNGKTIKLKATVKGTSEYKGTPQTEVTRAKIVA